MIRLPFMLQDQEPALVAQQTWAYLFIALLLVGIFAWSLAARWWHGSAWKRRQKDRTDDTDD